MKLLEFLKRSWPQLVQGLVTLGLGLWIGWNLGPERVEVVEKERVVERQVTTEAQRELMQKFEDLRVELQRVRETQVVEKYHREELETRLADGTYTKKVTVDKNIDSHTLETETKVEVRVVEVEKRVETVRTETVDKVVEVEKIVTRAEPQWHVSVLGGIAPTLIPPSVGTWVAGAEVERRILGPVFIGAWGLGTGTGQGMGGLKVGIEF